MIRIWCLYFSISSLDGQISLWNRTFFLLVDPISILIICLSPLLISWNINQNDSEIPKWNRESISSLIFRSCRKVLKHPFTITMDIELLIFVHCMSEDFLREPSHIVLGRFKGITGSLQAWMLYLHDLHV